MADMFSGGTPNTQNRAYWDGAIPWVSPKDFGDFEIINSTDRVTEAAIQESSSKIAPKNSVLLVVRSGVLIHTLPIGVAGRDLAINQDVKAITCRPTILPQYLATYFRVFQDRLLPVITKFGATVQSINTAELRNLDIPVPSLTIQKQIVGIYVDALAQMEKKRKDASQMLAGIDAYLLSELGITLPPESENNIANRIFTAQRQELAGGRFDPDMAIYSRHTRSAKYELAKLKKHILISPQYGANERGVERESHDLPRYVRITDVNAFGELSDGLGVTAEFVDEKYLLASGDLLFARSGNTVGKTYLHDREPSDKHIFAGYMIRFRLNPKTLLPAYAFSYTLCRAYREWCSAIQRAAGQPNINAEEYKNLLIPVPPIRKQLEIAKRVFEMRNEAKHLRHEAKLELQAAKRRIESMLLGEAT